MHRQEGGRRGQRETEGVKAKVHSEGRGMEAGKEGEEGREGEGGRESRNSQDCVVERTLFVCLKRRE